VKEEELPSLLMAFGLTRQEADLFVLLSRVRNSGSGGASGSVVAGLFKSGRVRTYQVLQHLTELGLVDVEPGRPKRYSAVAAETAVRRLLALQENKVTELSHLEREVAETLGRAPPLSAGKGEAEAKGEWSAHVLHGISNIQTLARRAMEDKDLRIMVNDQSEDHVFTTVRYMSRKPRSARVIFTTTSPSQKGFESPKQEIEGYTYNIRLLRMDLPTVILARDQCLLLFYTSRRYRPKPLSPITVRTVPSDCIVVDSPTFISQMEQVFEVFWKMAT
jgi:hypothetical protein